MTPTTRCSVVTGISVLLLVCAARGSAATISCPRAEPADLTALTTATPVPGTDDCAAEIPHGTLRLNGRWTGTGLLAGSDGTYMFDSRGRLLGVSHPAGLTSVRSAARLVSVTSFDGVTTRFTYNVLGQLLGVAAPGGSLASFTYTSTGHVAAISTPSGTTSYVYDAIDRLTAAVDEAGASTNVTYANGRIVTIVDGSGSTTLSYDGRGQLVQVNESGEVTSYAYDAVGQLISVAGAGGVTQYSYDAGLLVTVSGPGGTTSYSYDLAHRLVRVVEPTGAVTSYSYDRGRSAVTTAADGSVTRYSYDAAGRLTATTAPSGVIAYSYDAAGNITSIVDPAGRAMTFAYGRGPLPVDCPSDEATDAGVLRAPAPLPGTADCVVHIPGGAVRVSDGRWTGQRLLTGGATYRFDDLGRILEIVDASGNIVPVAASERLVRVVDFAGRTSDFGYDSLGRLTAVTGVTGREGSYGYGGGSGTGKVAIEGDAFGAITTYTYDALNRLTRVVGPSGNETSFVYGADGIISIVDAGGTTALTYSVDGDLLRVSGASQTVSYAYDASRRLVSVIDPAGNSTSYSYDAGGRLLTATNVAGVTRYAYDATGNLVGVTNPRGAVTSYTYEDGRIVAKLAANGTTIVYTYSAGQLTMAASSAKGVVRYTYDSAGRITSVTDRLSRTTSLAYAATPLHSTTGFGPPLGGDSTPEINIGTTVPLKFSLTGASAGIATLSPKFFFALVGQPEVSAGSFRFDGQTGQYVFQWKTKGLSPGDYLLRVDLGGGQALTAQMVLK